MQSSCLVFRINNCVLYHHHKADCKNKSELLSSSQDYYLIPALSAVACADMGRLILLGLCLPTTILHPPLFFTHFLFWYKMILILHTRAVRCVLFVPKRVPDLIVLIKAIIYLKVLIFLLQYKIHILWLIVERNIWQILNHSSNSWLIFGVFLSIDPYW